MAKISVTKKIAIEDMPSDQKSWIGKIIDPVNRFFENSYFALSQGLTIADNLKAMKFDLNISTSQVYPMKISWTLNEKPTSVVLGHIIENNGAPGLIPVHSFQWDYGNGIISIWFNGLEATKSYKAVIVGQV